MRVAITLPIATLLVGALAGPVSAAAVQSSDSSSASAATVQLPRSWACASPAGKNFTITVEDQQDRWTLLRYDNPCDHKWNVAATYRNSSGNTFTYRFTVEKDSKGIVSHAVRASWLVKLDARK